MVENYGHMITKEWNLKEVRHTVDGNQKSGEKASWGKGSLSHYLQGFSTIPGGDRRISEPSTVFCWFSSS